jgi:hypothetical protein
MAAIALLALGLGVWGLPDSKQIASREEVPNALVQAELKPAPAAGAADRQEPAALEEGARIAAEGAASHAPGRRDEIERRAASARVAQSKRAVAADVDEPSSPAADRMKGAAPGAEATAARAAEVTAAPAPASEAPEAVELSSACRRRIGFVEQRRIRAGDPEVAPEEVLAIGRCFQAAGKKAEARAWLERAARDPQTRARARRALRELTAD